MPIALTALACALLVAACAEGGTGLPGARDVLDDVPAVQDTGTSGDAPADGPDFALPDALTSDTHVTPQDTSADAPADTVAPQEDTSAPTDTGTDTAPDDTALHDMGCQPDCAGKTCGDDGCGGSCGACEDWQACLDGQCGCEDVLPPGWPSAFTPWSANPVLVATSAAPLQGQDNIYAPDIHHVGGQQVMWYGAQAGAGDLHDRIFVAVSPDGVSWRKVPSDADPQPALDSGGSNHVNDPSLVHVDGTWRMYYTDAPSGIDDEIWLATSSKLHGFTKVARVLDTVANSWESVRVGRPAVLHEGGVYKLWYDGTGPSGRHVGLATSVDGIHFTRHPANPLFLNAGAIDVEKVGDVYVMLREAGDGTHWATSANGVCWVDRGRLFGLSGADHDRYGQVTPFLQLSPGGAPIAVWYGGAQVVTWNENRIAVAWADGYAVPSGGGCAQCTPPGLSCDEACQGVGAGNAGVCAAPGSSDPGACCACQSEGCEGCAGASVDCQAACVAAGKSAGWCAHPGSSDPSVCCACL